MSILGAKFSKALASGRRGAIALEQLHHRFPRRVFLGADRTTFAIQVKVADELAHRLVALLG